MKIVIQLKNDNGKVAKEVSALLPDKQANRLMAWLRHYAAMPEGADNDLFAHWAQGTLDRLRTMVHDHEARQAKPQKGTLLS